MSSEVQNPKNLKSCFLNLSYTSGDTPSKIERIITSYFKRRGFDVKTGRMAPAGENTDKGILRVIKSCCFGIVVFNEPRHNICYEWGLMDALDMPVIPFLNTNMHIEIDKDFSDKKANTFVVYSGDSDKEEIIKELENSESLKSTVEYIERLIAEQISSEETTEAKDASKLLIESNMLFGEIGVEVRADTKGTNEIINALDKVKNLTVEGRLNRATAYYHAEKDEEAEKEIRGILQTNPDLAIAHSNLGLLLYNSERYREAEKEWREAIRINPDYAEAHSNLGVLLKHLKRYREAEKEWREAIRINTGYAEAHFNLGLLLKYLKRYDEVKKEWREAIRINPDYAEAHFNLGLLLYNSERYSEAEKEWREAIRINPDYAEAHFNRGVLLKYLKRYDEAKKEWREAIRINPDYAEAHANLGYIFLKTERPEEARTEFEIAKELFDNQGSEEDVKTVKELLANIQKAK
jgi:tetratricopeptide (TPR) repeat protein